MEELAVTDWRWWQQSGDGGGVHVVIRCGGIGDGGSGGDGVVVVKGWWRDK